MTNAKFQVLPADWVADYDDLRLVREKVFIEEQKVDLVEEWDKLDAVSKHVIARDLSGKPIGTGRLTPKQKIGRMAVMADWRGKGVGEAMMLALMTEAQKMGYQELRLNAQLSAAAFYQKFGFVGEGEHFLEASIWHQSMVRSLISPLEDLPADDEKQFFHNSVEASAAVDQIAHAARYKISIYIPELHGDVFDRQSWIDALRKIATAHAQSQIQVLIHESFSSTQRSHRMVALAHRLPSKVVFRRVVVEDDLKYPSAFVINDQSAYLFCPHAGSWHGEFDLANAAKNRELQEYFQSVWEYAEADPELRHLVV